MVTKTVLGSTKNYLIDTITRMIDSESVSEIYVYARSDHVFYFVADPDETQIHFSGDYLCGSDGTVVMMSEVIAVSEVKPLLSVVY